MSISRITALSFLASASLICAEVNSHEPPSQSPIITKEIAGLIEILSKDKYSNLQFNFSLVESFQTSNQHESHKTAWYNGSMLASAMPNSLIKVSYDPATTTWVDGKAPYFQEIRTIAYNGKYWLSKLDKQGPVDGMAPYRVATITENCPADWKSPRWSTGEMFFLGYAQIYDQLTLKEFLEQPQHYKFVSINKENNLLKVVIATPSDKPNQIREIWLDLDKGGVLKKVISKHNVSREGEFQFEVEDSIEEFANVNGIWFPSKAKRTVHENRGVTTLEFTANNFSMLPSSTDMYEVKLEPGFYVIDERINTTFVVGKSVDDTIKSINLDLKK